MDSFSWWLLLVVTNVASFVATSFIAAVVVLVPPENEGQQEGALLGLVSSIWNGGAHRRRLSQRASCCACTAQLQDALSAPSIVQHLAALQDAADESGGRRSAGTPGFEATVAYIVQQLEAAGYDVATTPAFPTDNLQCQWECCAQLRGPDNVEHGYSTDFWETYCCPAAAVEGPTRGVPNGGCRGVSDFANFIPGEIALIERSDACFLDLQVQNARTAGAIGVIVYNDAERSALYEAFLYVLTDIPVFTATHALGLELLDQEGSVMTMEAFGTAAYTDDPLSKNIIAERRPSDTQNYDNPVIMVGAHIDSVGEGPGINDNGSGAAMVLQMALSMTKETTKNPLRFAWWGAEEVGKYGSFHYVLSLSEKEQSSIAAYLNFDMIASRNFVRSYYVPESSREEILAQFFINYFQGRGWKIEPFDMDRRSDHDYFQRIGIPTNGLTTGFDHVKTEEEQKEFGGTAGIILDPCYHLACDTLDNIQLDVLEQMAQAAAHVALLLANRDNADLLRPPPGGDEVG